MKKVIIGILSFIGTWTIMAKTTSYLKKHCTKNENVDEKEEFFNAFSAPQSMFMGYNEGSEYYEAGSKKSEIGHQDIKTSVMKGWNLMIEKIKGAFSKKNKTDSTTENSEEK